MKPITFDRFVRGLVAVVLIILVGWTFNRLSSVIIPFLVAGVLAYMLNPVVDFLQKKCRLRFRFVCVILTLVLFVGTLTGLLWLCVPPMLDECDHLEEVVLHYIEDRDSAGIPLSVREFVDEHIRIANLNRYLQSGNLQAVIKDILPHIWAMITSAANAVIHMVAWLFALLYLFFLMMDYDKCAQGWISYVPVSRRPVARQIVNDIGHYMGGYFRGQCGIALSNCVLFTLGFLLVGFPMPLALGCFIGIISFVPYLQVAGLLPATILALLRAADTGQNFWLLIGSALLVYIVVQIIQDAVVTPRIMGKIMGLSPAIILLSLSIGGSLFGIIGLIIALPVTTLALRYYKHYVVGTPFEAC